MQAPKAVEQITIMPLALKLAGPSGYCIDPETVQQNPSGGFAVLASCHRLSGQAPKRFAPPAIMTLTVALSDAKITPEDIEKLASGLNTDQIIKRYPAAKLPLFQLTMNADGPVDGNTHHQHWRGAIALDDKLVSLSAFLPSAAYGTDISGDALIVQTAAILRRLNAGSSLASALRGNANVPIVRPKLRPSLRVNLRPMIRPKKLIMLSKSG